MSEDASQASKPETEANIIVPTEGNDVDDGDRSDDLQSSSARESSSSSSSSFSGSDEESKNERKRKRDASPSAAIISAEGGTKRRKRKKHMRTNSHSPSSSDEEETENVAEEVEGPIGDKGAKRKKTGKERNRKRKGRNMRRNIKDVLNEQDLEKTTKEAQAEEAERLHRLQELRKQRLQQAFLAQIQERQMRELQVEQKKFQKEEPQLVHISSSEDEKEEKAKSSDSDVKILSEDEILAAEEAADDEDDPNNSGMHVDDSVNVPDAHGRVLVNTGHPSDEPDIFLAPQLARTVKPHQIGGIRFLFDNIVESVGRYRQNPGYGCVLAHSMGLGKTIQIVSFCDIFLRHTEGKRVLIIVPINTLQNWLSEFNMWLPEKPEDSYLSNAGEVRPRSFKIHVLNDALKNLEQRSKVIVRWMNEGGVLLMGYELYRQLANKKPRKRKRKNAGPECIDIEEEDKAKTLLDDIQMSLVDPGPDLVVCDEGHRIKNSHASISQALKAIRTKRRIVLTGYPLQNNLMEYWCMVDFIRPNFLGTKTEFSNMFERPIQNGQCVDSTPKDVRVMMHRAHVLHNQLQGFVQRRGHKVLQKSLPPKTEHVLLVRMTPVQRNLYKRFMNELIYNKSVSNPLKAFAVCCKIWNHPDVLYNFLRKKEAEDFDFEMDELLERVQTNGASKNVAIKRPPPPLQNEQLQQQQGFPCDLGLINDGPGFNPFAAMSSKKDEINYDWANGIMSDYVPGIVENSTKFEVFFAILEETIKAGDRLLLFSQSLLTLSLLEEFLRERTLPGTQIAWTPNVNYFRLDGSTPGLERERLINSFNNAPSGVSPGAIPLFIISTRAGSLGINLVGANRVVVFDASWNPCHDSQAVCRVYRYGQLKHSHIYRLVTDNSIEKKIYDRQVNKQGMADRVVDEQNPDNHLSSKEINSLICDNEDDPPPIALSEDQVSSYPDVILQNVLYRCQSCLAKAPFAHESLLIDRKDKKLTKAEKRLALKSYELELGSKVSYSRPSYAAFYPKPALSSMAHLNSTSSNGSSRSRYFDGPSLSTSYRPVASVRPYFDSGKFGQEPMAESRNLEHQMPTDTMFAPERSLLQSRPWQNHGYWSPKQQQQNHRFPPEEMRQLYFQQEQPKTTPSQPLENGFDHQEPSTSAIFQPSLLLEQQHDPRREDQRQSLQYQQLQQQSLANKKFPVEALNKQQGVAIQDLIVPKDMMIPTNTSDGLPIALKKGQRVMVIRTAKGIYMRMDEKIIKIRLPPGLLDGAPSSGSAAPLPQDLVTVGSSDSSSDNDVLLQRQQALLPNPVKELYNFVASATSSSASSVSNSPKPL